MTTSSPACRAPERSARSANGFPPSVTPSSFAFDSRTIAVVFAGTSTCNAIFPSASFQPDSTCPYRVSTDAFADVNPRPGGGLTSAKASVETLYGHVESGWKLADGKMALHVEVPANTTAMVRLSKAKLDGVTEGGKPLAERADLSGARQAGDDVVMEVGSGKYEFESVER